MRVFLLIVSLPILFMSQAFADTLQMLSDNTLLPDTVNWANLGTAQISNPYHAVCDAAIVPACSVDSTDSVLVDPVAPSGGALYVLSTTAGFGRGFGFTDGNDLLYNGGFLGTQTKGAITLNFDTPVAGAGR